MKKILSILVAACLFLSAFSQEDTQKYPYKKRSTLGVHFTLHDFQTAADLKAGGLSGVLSAKQWHKTSRMNPGFAFSYAKGLTDNLDVMARLGFSFLRYPLPDKPSPSSDKGLVESDVNLHMKLTSDKYWISPFLTIGAGASQYSGYYAAYIPAGLGLQVNFFDETFLFLNANYRLPVTGNAESHLFYALGLGGAIGKKKEAAVPPPSVPVIVPPKDMDNDGIFDSLDACPTVPGLAQFNGCPDRDSDGIEDRTDKCPDVAGLAKYEGCPIPDTDKDGVNDEEDKCPNEPGLERYQGCPIPDKDGDGINDEEDKCPEIPGVPENQGCPKIDFNAKNVQFITGKATLTAAARKELDKGADILLNTYPDIKISIEGHTDNTGTAAFNKTLSQRRAEAVKAYLVGKKVSADRLSAVGFGADVPIADNKTSKGRAANRRVEFRLSQ